MHSTQSFLLTLAENPFYGVSPHILRSSPGPTANEEEAFELKIMTCPSCNSISTYSFNLPNPLPLLACQSVDFPPNFPQHDSEFSSIKSARLCNCKVTRKRLGWVITVGKIELDQSGWVAKARRVCTSSSLTVYIPLSTFLYTLACGK